MTEITTKDGYFVIKNAPASTMLKIQSAKWYAHVNGYVMPASPAGAKILYAVLGDKIHADGNMQIGVGCYYESQQIKNNGFCKGYWDSIKTKPWLHQSTAIHYALSLPSVMLAMEMGTGKSLVAIAVAGEIKSKLTLILCPKSVVNVWPNQFQTHSSLSWDICTLGTGSTTKNMELLENAVDHQEKLGGNLVVVVNYDSVWRNPLGPALAQIGFDLLILDESHRIKTHSGKASKYVGASLSSIPKKLALTGTPVPHSWLDIFAQYRVLDPAIFGQFITKFRKRYCIIGPFGMTQVVGWQNEKELSERFHMIAIEAKKADCLDLPLEVDEVVPVELSKKTQDYYDEMEKNFYIEVEEKQITASNAMTKMLRLQQITSGFAKSEDGELVDLGTDKLEALKNLMEDIPDETKVTIFCRFTRDIASVKTVMLAMGRTAGELSGQRNDLSADAKYPLDINSLIVQIQSGSVGVDFSRSSVAIYYSLGLSLGDYLQSRSRLHRPGQENKVTYIHLLASKTIDVKAYKALLKREELIKYIMRAKDA